MKQDELKQLLASGQPVRIIDVREADEVKYDQAQLKYLDGEQREQEASIEHIPMGQVFIEEKKGNLSKKEKIVAVCKSGKRCAIVARELRDAGYDIDHLEGGLDEWTTQ